MATVAPEQQVFDYFVGFGSRQFLTIDEVAGVIRLNRNSIINLCDLGKLEWHKHCPTGETNITRRITRRSVVAYMASTAEYDAKEWGDSLITAVQGIRDAGLLDRIIRAAQQRKARLQ